MQSLRVDEEEILCTLRVGLVASWGGALNSGGLDRLGAGSVVMRENHVLPLSFGGVNM